MLEELLLLSGINFPYWLQWTIDERVFGFAICVVSVLIAGLWPALKIARTNVADALKEGSHSATLGRRSGRLMSGLLAVELAFTMVLLAGAAVTTRGFVSLYRADLVIDPSEVVFTRLALPERRYPTVESQATFFEGLEERLGGVSRIESSTIASAVPFRGAPVRDVSIDGRPAAAGAAQPRVSFVSIGPRYFETLGVTLTRGRAVTDLDATNGQQGVIVMGSHGFRQACIDSTRHRTRRRARRSTGPPGRSADIRLSDEPRRPGDVDGGRRVSDGHSDGRGLLARAARDARRSVRIASVRVSAVKGGLSIHPGAGSPSDRFRKLARASEHCRDLDEAAAKPADDSIRRNDDLADRRVLAFRNDLAGFCKFLQTLNCEHESFGNQLCVGGRVPGNERPDRLDVADGLRRPDDPVHIPSRRLASSWGTPFPASSSASPASILATNTRRSMASSNVASGGRSSSARMIRSRTVNSGIFRLYCRPQVAPVARIKKAAARVPATGAKVRFRHPVPSFLCSLVSTRP